MKYSSLVDVYQQLEATQSTLEKTEILADLFAGTDEEELGHVVLLAIGRVFPAWDDSELGISSSLTKEAIARTTGMSEDRIEDEWRETGDLGSAAKKLVRNKKQQTLKARTLTVARFHENLQEMASYEGEGSQEKKVDRVAELLSMADPEEAKYIVRTVVGTMRLGVGEGILRDAIVQAFFAEVLEPEEIGNIRTLEGTIAVESSLDGEYAENDAYERMKDRGEVELFDGSEMGRLPLDRERYTYVVCEGETYDVLAERAKQAVQHAYDVTNDFSVVARTARQEGLEGLDELEMELFRPIKVMLAQKAETMEDGFDQVADDEEGKAALEFKYDGMRTQIHKRGDEVRVFTRRLEDVTEQFPDIVEATREHIDAEECIIEGEAVAYDPEDRGKVPFQTLSKRIKRKYDIREMVEEIPVVVHLFDVTYLEGETIIDEPLRKRWQRLASILEPEEWVMDRAEHLETGDIEEARTFYQQSLNEDCEGIMLKNLDARYKPGSRVGYMVKLKPIMETLDLVIVEAEWSEGRKSDWLGRLFLACRDEETGELRQVGRMSTGFTDEQLAELTERLKPLIKEEDGRDVKLTPEVVVEVAYEEIQESPKYSSGYALRFPRFIQVREDLDVDGVDTLEKVERLFEDQ